jgi:hypothetical protein
MQECLSDLHLHICCIFIEDVIVFSRTYEEHVERLKLVFNPKFPLFGVAHRQPSLFSGSAVCSQHRFVKSYLSFSPNPNWMSMDFEIYV